MGLLDRLLCLLESRPGRQRSAEEQQQVDAATGSLSLYQFTACPYCFKVRRAIRRLALDIELRDASHNTQRRYELMTQGGKLQTPCLRIERSGHEPRWLYESAEIIHYLQQRFG